VLRLFVLLFSFFSFLFACGEGYPCKQKLIDSQAVITQQNIDIFVKKDTLPPKHLHIQEILTDLSGHLPIKFASDQLHVNEHIFSYDKMKLHREFEYKFVEDVKFVNIKKFFRENGIKVGKNSLIQLGKLKDLELSVDATFYRLKDDYAVVVYE